MKISKVILVVILLLKNFTCFAATTELDDNTTQSNDQKVSVDQCLDIPNKHILTGGWYLWQPYQYTIMAPENWTNKMTN